MRETVQRSSQHTDTRLIVATWLGIAIMVALGPRWFLFAQEAPSIPYATADSQAICELTLEELHQYSADFFPLYLAEKGRPSANTYRGMPPGFLDYQFRDLPLRYALWGYWDDQVVPIEIVRARQLFPECLTYRFRPTPIRTKKVPVTRIAYSQDYQFNLSQLDIDFAQHYTARSYFRLGGNNFLRDGPHPDYTSIHVETLRAFLHHEFSKRTRLDVGYWQLRHRYRLGRWDLLEDRGKVKRVGQLLWGRLMVTPDTLSRFSVLPYLYKWGENYRVEVLDRERRSEMYSIGVKAAFQRGRGHWNYRIVSNVIGHQITKSNVFYAASALEAEIQGELAWQGKWGQMHLFAGFHNYQYGGSAPSFGMRLSSRWSPLWEVGISLVQKPHPLPLAVIFWREDRIARRLQNPSLPLRQGIEMSLAMQVNSRFRVELTPFYYRFWNYWLYEDASTSFYQRLVENTGLAGKLLLSFWKFYLDEELLFSTNYQQSFTPRVNNILKLTLDLPMFNRALLLRGVAIYHLINRWRGVKYYPVVNQYVRTYQETNYYHLLDFKLLAHIKRATIFFAWENTLSTDYQIVIGYPEFFRTFRLGVYWTLFD